MAQKKPYQSPESAFNTRTGTVYRSTGSHYRVKDDLDGNFYECVIRGKFRLKSAHLRTTNPIAVGDKVDFFSEEQNQVIKTLHPRENYILRKATNLSASRQILCANVDRAVIVLTLKQPDMSLGFTDRFLMMTGAFHIPSVLIFNKIDLLETEDDFYYLDAYTELYRSIGYPVVHVSALDKKYISTVREVFEGKTSFLYGRSGAGKTSLVNLIAPDLDLRIGGLSEKSGRGTHTTTFAEMFDLNENSKIIDAPGLREFEPADIEKTEIAHYMPDLLKYIHLCKYNDCTHHAEPGCAVKEAVENGEIHTSRYYNYLNMLIHTEGEEYKD